MFEQISDDAMLEHNQREAKKLVRWKRWIAVGLFVLGVPIVFLAPSHVVYVAWGVLLVLALVAMGTIELLRFRVFKRDRQEQRRGGR